MSKTPLTDDNKKNHWIDYLGVKALRASHPGVRRLKRQQRGHNRAHGNKVWRSSFVLMDYLTTYPPSANAKVLDIGCGWGLTSIFLAKHHNAQVTGVDIDSSVAPYLSLQADINNCKINFQQRSFESFKTAELASYDYLIGADICFWDEMTQPLFDLIDRARESCVGGIFIADPGRPPFWKLAEQCTNHFDIEIVSRRINQPFKTEKYILSI